jgi:hypothetical protein
MEGSLPVGAPLLLHGIQDRSHRQRGGRDRGRGAGRAILQFNEQYITGPEKLWATVLASAALGIVFFAAVRLAELLVLRNRQAEIEA